MTEHEKDPTSDEVSEKHSDIRKKSIYFYGLTCRCGGCSQTFTTATLRTLSCPTQRCEVDQWVAVIVTNSNTSPIPELFAALPDYTVDALRVLDGQSEKEKSLGTRTVHIARADGYL